MTTVSIPRLVVGGTASGVGKTTFVVGLIKAFRSLGLKVAAFKCGPDYLDPTYHARAAGSPSYNLDGWMMGRDAVLGTFARVSAGADIAIIEGVMGLYDGASPNGDQGSTAEIAKWLQSPVLLVVDASGMARTIGAIGYGFAGFDPSVRLTGIICNRVGSRSHLQLLREVAGGVSVLGAMPEDGAASFPKRHLGLRTADEVAVPETIISSWGKVVLSWCDLGSIILLARQAPPLTIPSPELLHPQTPKCKIGLAFDEAFHFYYEDNLRRLERAGAELVLFSPVHDKQLPAVDGLYIGGGYPEVHASELAANSSMRLDIQGLARSGRVIYAECGGLMYLCSTLRTLDEVSHPMCGVLPGETTMCERLQELGYVEVETTRDSIIGRAGLRFRGHQFRYSNIEIKGQRVTRVFDVARRRGGKAFPEGYHFERVLGSYVHAHWASNPSVPRTLVETCSHGANRSVVGADEGDRNG